MNPNDLTFLKSKVPLLAYFTDAKREELASGSRLASFEPGQPIAFAGDEVHFLGVMLEGTAVISVLSDGGERQALGKFTAGDTFGEMALMTGDRALADVIAETRCRVMLIPLTLFRSIIMAEPRAVQHVSQTLTSRLQKLMQEPAKAAAVFRKQEQQGLLELKGERPERILVLNSGSSSLKYSFFDTEDEAKFAQGVVERIGSQGTRLIHRGPRGEVKRELPQGTYSQACAEMLHELSAKEGGVIRDPSEITAVGHRVVHGGERFSEGTVIDAKVLAEIEALNPLAPLHNPVNVLGIKEAQRVFPAVPHVAVFDTAFHQTLPNYAYLYGLPSGFYEQDKVRRYGFHGTSHAYVTLAGAQFLNRRARELKIVSCHLGNGASLCAVEHGRSVDTSMGFTPGEGLIMGTRCGDLDSGVFAYLEREKKMTGAQIDELLNKKSGLLGLSGVSSDVREIEKAANDGNACALVALKTFCYRVRKYIGAYVAAMGGIDVLLFTGGIGQGSAGIRSLTLQGLGCMGLHNDEQRNREARGFVEVCRISTDDSPVTVLVVPTNEERMIARETLRALSRSYLRQTLVAHAQEPILVEVSAHHVHLSPEHVEALFGKGHQLTKHADLSQPGQYACKEQVTLAGPRGRIERVRVLGPTRKATQVEIALTEQFKLGIHPPIRESGDIADTPGCTLEGPAGAVALDRGVICALRHIHMTPQDALRYGVRDKASVRVRVTGDREMTFGDVRVRVDPNFRLAMHIDTDEANAANIQTGAQGIIEGIQSDS
ncbi:MAG: acetate/propionate family kinase [Verrucomicrobia subdivision 3 bacterium]|nr:acetate/propionate family kinase [Limisphaerales bacterium]